MIAIAWAFLTLGSVGSDGSMRSAANRAPLVPSLYVKLPIGSIRPAGWIRKQLQLEADGFVGHLTEISSFLKKDHNAWYSPTGEGDNGWEELPYWLKGFGDLGYVLGDDRIIREARGWLEAIIASQRADGYFGPRSNLTRENGKPDIWPNMLALNALQSFYEATGDDRILPLMSKYFHWIQAMPEADLLLPDWQKIRGGDCLASVYWLYNRTGEPFLLDVAKKIHERTSDWTAGVASWHGVDFAQGFREPATFFVQSKNEGDLRATDRDFDAMVAAYGQVPGGMYGADENAREGYSGPRQATETCAMVEMMLSDEMLMRYEGTVKWADRCEDVAFNSLPASMTADAKALHYLTSPNQIVADRVSKAPGVQNSGPMFFFDPNDHRCCQHNVSHGWPYYAENLWMGTPDGGLAALLLGPCSVTSQVSDGSTVTIDEETTYPFSDRVVMRVHCKSGTKFPMSIRIPGWAVGATVKAAGGPPTSPIAGSIARISRSWKDGDAVVVVLPMSIKLTTWVKNDSSVSVSRGPLTYSLKIGERVVKTGGTEAWPGFEIFPTTAWNYGLVLDPKAPSDAFHVVTKPWPANDQPFEAESSPIEIVVPAQKIEEWKADSNGLVANLQPSPAVGSGPIERVELIPMGAARLRISAFPTVMRAPIGHRWVAPKPPIPAQASHCFEGDSLAALSSGAEPRSSHDQTIPRFTWWDHKGTTEWVEYDFSGPRKLSKTEVYWFDDSGSGSCRPPRSWKVLVKSGEEWVEVPHPSAYGIELDKFNRTNFDSVSTTAIRIEVRLNASFSGGILQWRVD